MKVLIFYRPNSEQERQMENFKRDFTSRYPFEVEPISLDEARGADLMQAYGAIDSPVIIAAANDGSIQNMWQGSDLPLIDEVAGYLVST